MRIQLWTRLSSITKLTKRHVFKDRETKENVKPLLLRFDVGMDHFSDCFSVSVSPGIWENQSGETVALMIYRSQTSIEVE